MGRERDAITTHWVRFVIGITVFRAVCGMILLLLSPPCEGEEQASARSLLFFFRFPVSSHLDYQVDQPVGDHDGVLDPRSLQVPLHPLAFQR